MDSDGGYLSELLLRASTEATHYCAEHGVVHGSAEYSPLALFGHAVFDKARKKLETGEIANDFGMIPDVVDLPNSLLDDFVPMVHRLSRLCRLLVS